MRSILVLCREETIDVKGLVKELTNRGNEVIVAQPHDIIVESGGAGNRFFLKETPFLPSGVFGWVSLHQREYGMWLLRAFELEGIPVINGVEVLEVGQNKFLNSVLLTKQGIPHIPTYLVGNSDHVERIAEKIGFPLVLKPNIGAKGQQVVRVDDANALRNITLFYMEGGKPLYMQKCVEKPGRDIRVRVINHQAEFAFYRYTDQHGFITNLSKGGTWEECPLTPQLVELAERCSHAFRAPVAGVDVVENEHGEYLVIEVNVTPAITYPRDETVLLVADLIEKTLNTN